ncbi:MAG: TIGR02597 family protein [Luteolibacter sp.]
MNHSLIGLAGIALALLPAAHASTVVLSAVPTSRSVVGSNGTTTVTSGLVWVGTFGNETFSFDPLLTVAQNVSAIAAVGGWYQFGLDAASATTNLGTTVDLGVTNTLSIRTSPAGRIGGSITDNNSGAAKADFFNGKALYLWVFNGSTPEDSTELGIFRAGSATVPWNFATNAGGIGDSVTYSTTAAGAPTIAAIGGAGSTTTSTFQLAAAVPEPSTAAMGALAMLGIVFRRRRALPLAAVGMACISQTVLALDAPNAPIGFITQNIAGGGSPSSPKISVITPALTQPVVWEGTVLTVSTNTTGPSVITVTGNPWTDNQFNGANGSYYVEVISGVNSGALSDITATTAGLSPENSSITTFDNFSAFAGVGKTIKIRKHVTLGGFFGAANEAGLLASDDPSTADEILIYSGASAVAYFYYTGDPAFPAGWYDSGFSAAPGEAAKVVIAPNQGVVVKRKAANPVTFAFSGVAKVRNTLLPVVPGINVLGTVSAGNLTLAKSGLFTGSALTGITASDDPSTGDELTIYRPSGQLSYFYYSGDPDYPAGWYDSGFTLAPGEAADAAIPVGSAFVLNRKSGPAFNWSQPAPASF